MIYNSEPPKYTQESFNSTEEDLLLRTNFATYEILTRLERGVKPVALLGNKNFSFYIEIEKIDEGNTFSCSIATPQETDLLLYDPTLESVHLETDEVLLETMNKFLIRLLESPRIEMSIQKHNIEQWIKMDRSKKMNLGLETVLKQLGE